MAKIDHIENISDMLAQTTIAVLPKRCSYIRNWNSKCRSCLNACPHDAIERSLGRLDINSELCTSCGACTAACPTSTMLTTAPQASEIVAEARLSAHENEGHAVFACAELMKAAEVDSGKVAVLPCLDYLDEYLITGLFALDVKSVTLLRNTCADCHVDGTHPRIEATVASVKGVFDLWNVNAHVRLTERIPSQVRPTRETTRKTVNGQSRRDAFKRAGGSVIGQVAQAVNDAVGSLAGEAPKHKQGGQIVVKTDDVYPADTCRSVRMLNMLDRIGTRPRGKAVETRFWADVKTDQSQCKHCGMCAKMCVTGALKFVQGEQGKSSTLTFTPSLCTNCRMCKDICFTHSMVYSTKVLADDLDADVVKTLFVHTPEDGDRTFPPAAR